MALEHDNLPNLIDAMPQSVIVSRRYGLRVTTYPARRFIPSDPVRGDSRGVLSRPVAKRVAVDPVPDMRRDLLEGAVVIAFIIVLLIGLPSVAAVWH